MDTTWQKFRAAIVMLAKSGTVKERLHSAYRAHLLDVEISALPLELRGDFSTLHHALSSQRPLRGEDSLAASIRKLSCHEADALAAMLVEIFARMSGHSALDAPTELPNGNSAQVIPLFAAESRA